MGSRYYRFFAIMRMAMMNKQLEFSAPGNKLVYKVLCLLRYKGLISGFVLDFERKNNRANYWTGYPKYKVFLKYSYLGYPVIKKLDCYKMTKTNFTIAQNIYPKGNKTDMWIITAPNHGIKIIDSNPQLIKTAVMLARIKI